MDDDVNDNVGQYFFVFLLFEFLVEEGHVVFEIELFFLEVFEVRGSFEHFYFAELRLKGWEYSCN